MSTTPFAIIKREDLVPKCPHCERELTEVYMRTKGFELFVGLNVVYFCPECRKVLGFGQSRMI